MVKEEKKPAFEELLEQLKNEDWKVRKQAVLAIGIIENKQSIDVLSVLFEKEIDKTVKKAIVLTLAEKEDEDALAIVYFAQNDCDLIVQTAAKNAIKKFEQIYDKPFLKKAQTKAKSISARKAEKSLIQTREYIIQLEEGKFSNLFENLVHDDCNIRKKAWLTLDKLEGTGAVIILLKLLGNSSDQAFFQSMKILEKMPEKIEDKFIIEELKVELIELLNEKVILEREKREILQSIKSGETSSSRAMGGEFA
ncbi:MAG: HEAT repeat domain-containing protein [Candidatus Heimdallarchaeaceae archaeon]